MWNFSIWKRTSTDFRNLSPWEKTSDSDTDAQLSECKLKVTSISNLTVQNLNTSEPLCCAPRVSNASEFILNPWITGHRESKDLVTWSQTSNSPRVILQNRNPQMIKDFTAWLWNPKWFQWDLWENKLSEVSQTWHTWQTCPNASHLKLGKHSTHGPLSPVLTFCWFPFWVFRLDPQLYSVECKGFYIPNCDKILIKSIT